MIRKIDDDNGSIFSSGCQALVNPVNCIGVSGKGLALEFRNRYPYVKYLRACTEKKVTMGNPYYCKYASDNPFDGTTLRPEWIVYFPTKNHWRDPSYLGSICTGLENLVDFVGREALISIAIPALGCGLGGLNWRDVYPEIEKYMKPQENLCEIIVFSPHRQENPS